jgi:hypothetical protein
VEAPRPFCPNKDLSISGGKSTAGILGLIENARSYLAIPLLLGAIKDERPGQRGPSGFRIPGGNPAEGGERA